MSALDDLVAVLTTAGVRAYKLGEVPASPVYPYAVLSLSPMPPRVRTMDAAGDRAGRFKVQHFGRTDASVSTLADVTFGAFDGKALPLAGSPVAEQEISTDPYRDPDDQGVLDILHTYRY